ncbi:uncharacterized protein GJ701_001185 [Geothlypis trichas]
MSCRGGKHLSAAPRPARAAPRARLAFGPAAAGGPWAAGGGGPGAERAGPRAGGGRSAARMAPRRPTPPLPAASTAVPPPRAAEGRAAPHGLQQISFEKLWHIVQSAEKQKRLQEIGSFHVLGKISEVPANVSGGASCWVQ